MSQKGQIPQFYRYGMPTRKAISPTSAGDSQTVLGDAYGEEDGINGMSAEDIFTSCAFLRILFKLGISLMVYH
jgi:hypothetical protein